MATSKISVDFTTVDNIYLASTATIDDLFSTIGNAISARGEGKTIVFSATWDGHDLFTGQGLYKWGVAFFMVANGTYIYVVTFNISTQTISYKKRVLVSSFE